METNDLVTMLSHGDPRIGLYSVCYRFALAIAIGSACSTMLLIAVYGVRSDMPTLLERPIFWMKVAFPLFVVIAALWLTLRLSRPGTRTTTAWFSLVVLLALVWLTAIVILINAPSAFRLPLIFGTTWRTCTLSITALSIPPFLAIFWAMKDMASTRPMLAGAAIGLLSGAQGALLYSFYCVELAVPFWAIWYVLGILMPTVPGVLLGRIALLW